MKDETKIALYVTGLIFISGIIVGLFIATLIPMYTFDNPDYHSYTYTIYNDGFLQNNYIECVGNKLINIQAFGTRIYVGYDWVDKRAEKESWCND